MLGTGLIAAVVLTGAGPAQAEPYRNSTYHFSLELNNYWKPLTTSELAEAIQVVEGARTRTTPSTLVDGFCRRAARPWHKPPVILVNFIGIKTSDLSSEELERDAGREIERGLRDAHRKDAGDITDISIGTAAYDHARKRLVLRAQGTLRDGSKFELLAAGHISTEGIVCLTYLTSDTATEREIAFFDRVNDSFRFDAGYEFVPVEHQPPLLERLLKLQTGGMAKPALVGGGVLVVVVLIGLLGSRKEKNSKPW
ncbi:MAG: hypothetical protein JWO38_2270 [Gemmataceae bacterium]|nr:hypothetical protein [Gemmataceae bacterium]